jgi:hypothetical protein
MVHTVGGCRPVRKEQKPGRIIIRPGQTTQKREDAILPFQDEGITSLFLFGGRSFLGCLERIHLGFFTQDFHFHMGGEITDASQPFAIRSRIGAADPAYGPFDDSLTPFTVFSNYLA